MIVWGTSSKNLLYFITNVEIKYSIVKESGPDHNKVFESKVECNGRLLGTGVGKTKKASEMEAAKNALENI